MQFLVLAPKSCCGTRSESIEILFITPSVSIDGTHAVYIRKLLNLRTSKKEEKAEETRKDRCSEKVE